LPDGSSAHALIGSCDVTVWFDLSSVSKGKAT
jgi:hypothetical protein